MSIVNVIFRDVRESVVCPTCKARPGFACLEGRGDEAEPVAYLHHPRLETFVAMRGGRDGMRSLLANIGIKQGAQS